jgi:F-type H+-transporting ATPase subunit b
VLPAASVIPKFLAEFENASSYREKSIMQRRALCASATLVFLAVLPLACWPGRAAAQESTHESRQKDEAESGKAHAGAASEATHGGAEAGHAAEEGKANPMELQPSLALWTVVVFLGLLILLTKYAWKPLSEALHHREEHLEHCLLQSEKARNESEQLLAEHKRLMAQADDRVKALLDKAQKDAQQSGEQIIKAAQAEAEAARERAQREIATARDQALAEIWSQTANVAVSVAGRVLSKELSADEHRRLLDLAIRELPPGTGGNGQGGSRP